MGLVQVQWESWRTVSALIVLVAVVQIVTHQLLQWHPFSGEQYGHVGLALRSGPAPVNLFDVGAPHEQPSKFESSLFAEINISTSTRNIWSRKEKDVTAEKLMSFRSPSKVVWDKDEERFEIPQNYTPVRAQACRVEPNGNPDAEAALLVPAGSLDKPNTNVRLRSQDCWQHCRDTSGCRSWFWCDLRKGCTDLNGRMIAYKGCELRHFEVIKQLGRLPGGWQMSTFATGFMQPVVPTEQVGQYTASKYGGKVLPKPRQNMVITTSLWPRPCANPGGDRVNQLSIVSKVDYARLHGYEFHLFTKAVDKSLPKLYSKIGLLRKLLSEVSRERAEWIFWIDADTLIMNLPFQLPFHLYHNKTFIAWGVEDSLLAGNPNNGINTGSMILRNDKDVSPRFWKHVAQVSRINQQMEHGNPDTPEGRIKLELEDQVQTSGSLEDLCDQNVIVYLLRVMAKDYMHQTLLEDGRFCLNCWFKDVSKAQAHTPFVAHFAACQMCTATNPAFRKSGSAAQKWSDFCHSNFMDSFAFTNHSLAVILGCERNMKQWGPPLGQRLNPVHDCRGRRGQPGCPPLPPLTSAKPKFVSASASS